MKRHLSASAPCSQVEQSQLVVRSKSASGLGELVRKLAAHIAAMLVLNQMLAFIRREPE
jgi:hypothetical protein